MPLPTRIGRLRPPVLSFVAEPAKGKDVESAVSEAVAGGVSMVQLQAGGLAAGDFLSLARRLKSITRGKALLVIHDRVDVAIAVEADGIALPENGLPTLTARGLIGKYAVLGRSISSVDDAHKAGREGAEFVVAGTEKDPAKPELISEFTKDSSLPVLAMGAITVEKIEALINAGAAGIAVESAITSAAEPKAAAEELQKALREAWTNRTSETVPAPA